MASAGSFFRQARNKSIMDHFWIGGRWGRHSPRLIFTKGKYLVGLNVVLYDMVIAQLKILGEIRVMSDTKKKKSTTKKSQSISREVFFGFWKSVNDSDGYIEDLHALCTSKSKGITLNSVRSRCYYCELV